MVPLEAPPSPHDEVSEAAGAAPAQRERAVPISCCPLNVILDHVAVETQRTRDESIEFSSDATIILGLVYKHTFRMLWGYHSLVRCTPELLLRLGTQLQNEAFGQICYFLKSLNLNKI